TPWRTDQNWTYALERPAMVCSGSLIVALPGALRQAADLFLRVGCDTKKRYGQQQHPNPTQSQHDPKQHLKIDSLRSGGVVSVSWRFENFSAFHHEINFLEHADVAERVAFHRHQVSVFSRSNAAYVVLHAQQLGGAGGCRTDGLRGSHAVFDHEWK